MAVTITSIAPLRARAGDTITVTGTGFNTDKSLGAVTIGGVTAWIRSASATVLTVTVPAGLAVDVFVSVLATNLGTDEVSSPQPVYVKAIAAAQLAGSMPGQQPGPTEDPTWDNATTPEAKDYERAVTHVESWYQDGVPGSGLSVAPNVEAGAELVGVSQLGLGQAARRTVQAVLERLDYELESKTPLAFGASFPGWSQGNSPNGALTASGTDQHGRYSQADSVTTYQHTSTSRRLVMELDVAMREVSEGATTTDPFVSFGFFGTGGVFVTARWLQGTGAPAGSVQVRVHDGSTAETFETGHVPTPSTVQRWRLVMDGPGVTFEVRGLDGVRLAGPFSFTMADPPATAVLGDVRVDLRVGVWSGGTVPQRVYGMRWWSRGGAGLARTRVLTDTAALSDSVEVAFGLFEVEASDTVSVSDTVASEGGTKSVAVSDAVALSDRSRGVFPIASPEELTSATIRLWLDADNSSAVTKDGSDRISDWANDAAGLAAVTSVSQATGSKQPLLVANEINSRDVVRWDGTTQELLATGSEFTGPILHLIVVARLDSEDQGRFMVRLDNTVSGESIYLLCARTTADERATYLNGTTGASEIGARSTNPEVFQGLSPNSNRHFARFAGGEAGPSIVNVTAVSPNQTRIGPDQGATQGEDLCEVYGFDGELSDPDLERLYDLIETRWGAWV